MLCIFDGVISNPKVNNKIISNLEHGALPRVSALVLHRTSAGTAESTLNAWKSKKSGAHFLIDKTGKIYQTASLKQKCWHIGLLQSRCRLESSCSAKDGEFIKKTLHGNDSWGSKFKKVYLNEKKKSYPNRYPLNSDSIGIELVGAYLGSSGDKGPFEQLKEPQANSFLWLTTELLDLYNLSFKDDIYAHGSIARKKVNEGVDALSGYRRATMKISLTLGLSFIFLMLGCSNQSENVKQQYSNIKIQEQGQSLDDDEVIASACKEFKVSKDSVNRFFSQSTTISESELHNQYNILPCYSTGTLNYNSKLYTWRIRAGGTGELARTNEIINKACSKVNCPNIPNLH